MKTILCICYVCISFLILSACSDSAPVAEPAEVPGKAELRLSFNPALSPSRADNCWKDEYVTDAPADDFDNKVGNIDVMLYTPDGLTVHVPWTAKIPAALPGSDIYEFIVTVECDSEWLETDVDGNLSISGKMVILANCPGTVDDGFSSVEFSQGTRRRDAIPMWGVINLDHVAVVAGESVSLGRMPLLRSMSKIVVELDEPLKALYRLKGARLNCFPAHGDAVPRGADGVTSVLDLSIEGCLNPVEGMVMSEMPFDLDPATGELTAYIPEIARPDLAGMFITVDIDDKSGQPVLPGRMRRIRFAEYKDGKPTDEGYDVIRNHSYRFTVRNVTDDLKLDFTVCDWNDLSTDIRFD